MKLHGEDNDRNRPIPLISRPVVEAQASTDSVMKPATPPFSPPHSAPNKFQRAARMVYNPLGFKKAYNFILFVIFAGAMFGFFLARLEYYDFNTTFKNNTVPMENFWYAGGHYRIGIMIHLFTALPLAFFLCLQFVPVIRLKAIIVHRISGYICLTLAAVTNAGALMIARRSMGGAMATQAAIGLLAIMTTSSLALGYYNIKRKQIEIHRAWMLRAAYVSRSTPFYPFSRSLIGRDALAPSFRAWLTLGFLGRFYFGTIITVRIIMIISATIISASNDFYQTRSCEEVAFMYGGSTPPQNVPQCSTPNGTAQGHISVKANINGNGPEQVGAALSEGFALGVSLVLHDFA